MQGYEGADQFSGKWLQVKKNRSIHWPINASRSSSSLPRASSRNGGHATLQWRQPQFQGYTALDAAATLPPVAYGLPLHDLRVHLSLQQPAKATNFKFEFR